MQNHWGPRISSDQNSDLTTLVGRLMGTSTTGKQELFDAMFRDNIPANGCIPDGRPILQYALDCECRPLALSLLNQPTVQPLVSSIPLDCFVWSLPVVEKLLELGYPVEKQIEENSAVTAQAIRSTDPKVIGLLVKHGMPVNHFTIGENTFSCLFHAANIADHDNLVALLKAGSDPYARDERGDTFLHKVLSNRASKPDPFVEDEVDGLRKLLKYCVQKKISLDQVNYEGRTAMHVAAKYGYIKSMTALLEYGAAADTKDAKNCTPLALAKKAGRTQVVQALSAHLARERIMNVVKTSGLRPAG